MKGLIALVLAILILAGCAGPSPETTEPSTVPVTDGQTAAPTESRPPETTLPPATTLPPETTLPPDPVLELLASMTLREKVGQLFFVAPEAIAPSEAPVRAWSEALAEGLARYPVGGIILFGDNIRAPEQLLALTDALRGACGIPLFLGVDEEGGPVARLAGKSAFDLPRYSSAAAVGASGEPLDAYNMGKTIGAYLAEYGFTVDFAPVADVNTNPNNPVIGSRAFSRDPEEAAVLARAFADGLNGQGITAVFKHFPGHGDTAQDSHYGLAVSDKTADELRACEWIPYRLLREGDWVMVGHIALPNVTGNNVPASLSPEIVTGYLREELGFSGIVITDAMNMGGVTQLYEAGEAAVLALEAGCDIILMPENLEEAFRAVITAVESGRFPEERLNAIVEKLLRAKGNLPL